MKNILERFEISVGEFTEIVDANPSLRGFILGYIGEAKAKKLIKENPSVSDIYKPDDHNRKSKGDLYIKYKGKEFRIEVKSLQTNDVQNLGGDNWVGKYQCDASDSREIGLPNGHVVKPPHYWLANLMLLQLAFINSAIHGDLLLQKMKNSLVAKSVKATKKSSSISAEDANYLIKGTLPITWPLKSPYTDDLFSLLDSML